MVLCSSVYSIILRPTLSFSMLLAEKPLVFCARYLCMFIGEPRDEATLYTVQVRMIRVEMLGSKVLQTIICTFQLY